MSLQIARQVGDALREARELVQSAATEGDDTAAVNAGPQANGHASMQTSSAAERDAAAHHSSSQADGSADAAVTASAHTGSEGAEMMVFEGEQLTPSELAIAQAAEKVRHSCFASCPVMVSPPKIMAEPYSRTVSCRR